MSLNIGINGMGRIGRLVFRSAFISGKANVTAVNDPFMDVDYLVYQLKYDTVHGRFPYSITKKDAHTIVIDGKHEVKVFTEKEPKNIPWG